MSSRFFRAISDSESDSSEEEELLSDEEQTQVKSSTKKGGDSDEDSDEDEDEDSDEDSDEGDAPASSAPRKPMSRFMRDADDSDSESEEEAPKVIKSAKDKRLDEFHASVHSIENAQRIDDWITISKEFDMLLRLCDRQRTLNEVIPPAYIKCMASLETFLAESLANKEATKKMKAPNAKAMNGMKSKVKKIVKENETAIQQFREDPSGYEAKVQEAQTTTAMPEVPQLKPKAAATAPVVAPSVEAEDSADFQTVGPGGKAVMTSEALFKGLTAVLEARGRKSTDRNEQISTLTKLYEGAQTPYQRIRVLLTLVAARFDYSTSANTYMPVDMWKQAREELNTLLRVLFENLAYLVLEETEDYDDEVERKPNENGEGAFVPIRGSVVSFIDRLEDEFTKSLQNIDPHATEYVERLCDEKLLYQTIVFGQSYFETVLAQSLPEKMAHTVAEPLRRCVMRRLELIYSKQDVIIDALETSTREALPDLPASRIVPPFDSSRSDGAMQLVHALCVYLYERIDDASERQRTRAILCHVYHHALHADYHVARDRFLMSHLQESIHMADAETQILYNRVLVQLGLCAFRVGLVRECHTALQEILATGRFKELLAQGVSKGTMYNSVSTEQEKFDRQRQLPFHMHINLELLECVYLVSSMLLEVPNMAYAGSDLELRKKVISRPFRRMLDYTDRLVFSGPPENTRDHIMQASKALQSGEWKRCVELIQSIKIWKLLPQKDAILEVFARHIQQEGLRTYLFNFVSYYDALSLTHLATMFELPESTVRSIISRMIWNDELPASIDPIHNVVVFRRTELNRVQQLSLALAERANGMLEQNEWLLDAKTDDHTRPGQHGSGDRQGGAAGDADDRRDGRRKGGRGGRGGGRVPLQSHVLSQKA